MDADEHITGVEVFRGSHAACLEYGLVLDAKGVGYERSEAEGGWMLVVAPALEQAAAEELRRYAAERLERREPAERFVPFAGAGVGSALYAFVLIVVAYCAGLALFGVDWLSVGAIDSRAGAAWDWWRPVTALTLHLDQEHLLGNLLFGVGAGVLAGRMFGPGVAWLAIVVSGAVGDYADMLMSPVTHRAVGASTAVFAALGLLAGFGWGHRPAPRHRRSYRWGPLFGGVGLLILLGAGAPDRQVDVLGHLLGFLAGVLCGWVLARAGLPNRVGRLLQWVTGASALLLVCVAWAVALARGIR